MAYVGWPEDLCEIEKGHLLYCLAEEEVKVWGEEQIFPKLNLSHKNGWWEEGHPVIGKEKEEREGEDLLLFMFKINM